MNPFRRTAEWNTARQFRTMTMLSLLCLLALVPLALYNGKPGKYRLKYFFYIFYPAHLVLLYAMGFLMR